MSTNSAKTWAPAPVAVEPPPPVRRPGLVKNLHEVATEARRTRAVGCTKESERDMAQDIIRLARSILHKIWEALAAAPAPAVQPRPQLNGRRGYGDDSIKPLD
jgi:hypothetical protein